MIWFFNKGETAVIGDISLPGRGFLNTVLMFFFVENAHKANVWREEQKRIKNSSNKSSEQYSKSDFLFDTLKWNNKIDFERPGEATERDGENGKRKTNLNTSRIWKTRMYVIVDNQ